MLSPQKQSKARGNGRLWLGVLVVIGGSAFYCWPWSVPKIEPSGHLAPRFTIGRDTTYITGPLDDEGFPNYEEAINLQMSKEIDPAENAVAVLQRALGPISEEQVLTKRFYEWLKIDPPETGGNYLVRYPDWAKSHGAWPDRGEKNAEPPMLPLGAIQKPWQAHEYPHVFLWLKINEQPLRVAIEASKKKQFFHPIFNLKNDRPQGRFEDPSIRAIAMVRNLGSTLICRAMLLMGSGKYEEAKQDLLGCHRLARLMQSSLGISFQHSFAMMIDIETTAAALILLQIADFPPQAIRLWQSEWEAVPQPTSMAAIVDLVERKRSLKMATSINRFGAQSILQTVSGTNVEDGDMFKQLSLSFNSVKFDTILTTVNRGVDRLAATGLMANRVEGNRALGEMQKELESSIGRSRAELQQFQNGILPQSPSGEFLGEMLGRFFLKILVQNMQDGREMADQSEEANRLFAIALSLAIHRAENGSYPASLKDLKPPLTATALEDLYSSKPHVYRKTAKGCLFYSVGRNGIDDGGSGGDQLPASDDVTVELSMTRSRR